MTADVVVRDRVLEGGDCPYFTEEAKTILRDPTNPGHVPKTTFAFRGPAENVICAEGGSTEILFKYGYCFWVGSGTESVTVYEKYTTGTPTPLANPESCPTPRWYEGGAGGHPGLPRKLIIEATGGITSTECYDVQLRFRPHHIDDEGNILDSYWSTMLPMTVMEVDLDIDSDNDGVVEVADPGEDSIESDPSKPGRLIRLNDDGVDEQDDLSPMVVDATPGCLHGSQARWKITYPAGKVKVWASTDECDLLTYGDPPISNPTKKTFEGKEYHLLPSGHKIKAPTPAFPYTLYVEGIGVSATQADVEIKVEYDVYNDGIVKCTDEVLATVFKMEVTNIKFNHNTSSSGSDALNIRENYSTPFDISNGEWRKTPAINLPVAYIKETAVTIQARLAVSPASFTSADIWAATGHPDGALGMVEKETVTFSGGVSSPEYATFDVSGETAGFVQKATLDVWQWKMENFNGSGSSVCDLNKSGTHTVYILLGEPTHPWNNTYGENTNVWTDALDMVCEWAYGATTEPEAAAKVTEAIYNSGYQYDNREDNWIGGETRYLNRSNGKFRLTSCLSEWGDPEKDINCFDTAQMCASFANAAGCGLDLYEIINIIPGGFWVNYIKPIGRSWTNDPFIDSGTPVRDGFLYHCTAWSDVWDPCLEVDDDDNPTSLPATGLLPKDMVFIKSPSSEPFDDYREKLVDPLDASSVTGSDIDPVDIE
jgi:hypothetical protein